MLLIAHRAGTDKYPEQCLEAVNFSLENGADMAEVDVRFTTDVNTPVVCHDANVKRVFGVDRDVCDMSLDEFLSLQQISNPEIGTYTLKTLLSSVSGKLLLHIKVGVEYFIPILRTIHECNAEEKVVLGVQEKEWVNLIKKDDSRIKILAFMPTKDELENFLQTDCEYIRLWEFWLKDEDVTLIHAKGKKLWVMSGTFDTVGYTDWNNLSRWQSMGADGILINEILKAQKILRCLKDE